MHDARTTSPARKEAGIVQRVRRRLIALSLRPQHVLVACSAGKDSVALAAVMAELHRLGLMRVSLAHVHHHQHDHGDAAAVAVEEIGRVLGLDAHVAHLDQVAIDRHAGVGREEALRRERCLALAGIANEVGADAIALAHHQQDQAETVLLHLIRGGGLDGLTGMREWELREIPWWSDDPEPMNIGLWRPFLQERADNIANVAASSGLPIVEDLSNTDTTYRRNAIRHQVLPLLEEIAVGSTAAIAGTAMVLQREQAIVASAVEQAAAVCIRDEMLVRDPLIELPSELQAGVVRYWLQSMGLGRDLARERIDAIVQMAARNRGGASIELVDHYAVILRQGNLTVIHSAT